MFEEAYLASDNARGQSGFSGREDKWERARKHIMAAMRSDGAFLDVGCASGLLMESVGRWAAELGYVIRPYGLDLSARLAALARTRLPQWAEQIYTGNVISWTPPQRFDYVRTELVYAPVDAQPALVERLLRGFVAPGGG